MQQELTATIQTLVDEVLTMFPSLFLIEVNLSGKTKMVVQVVLDGDKGITIDQCAEISRLLGDKIEERQLISSSYILEVTSPGLDRPLTLWRQYKANLGRTLSIQLQNGETVQGTLQEVTEHTLTLSQEVMVKEGKKKIQQQQQRTISMADIKKAMVMISFS
ncbi:MAG: ribosome maturation factor RimP, partial [Flammeovirgaceae bacterium]|nr:ribosome maturation factor RimP [Flammeovirgaceae bacterium]